MKQGRFSLAAITSALLASNLLSACVTGSSGGGTFVFAGVAIMSRIAQDASDQPSAAKLWCGTLHSTEAQLGLWAQEKHDDEDLIKSLTQSTYHLGRENGYSLHPQQIKELVLDAKHVVQDPVAKLEALKSCP